ncbi:aldehyde oxidase-like protein [Dorcoceras hygrometricum]|uniref:Aldehyde oxidase-like protein n=1 Tax=Dorcoceras hygrometricum TaxID=472368 RepID=A0A2Z7AGC6_9LAMI|nr:aldehyde oxidase-like protein [Dorcoceras hygrometricum]
MILVDGLWTVELCADQWVKIPRKVISTEVPRQRQFDDTLPSMSVFFRLMKKRWADVCLEVTDFCASRRLLPVGSINFCRALEIVETDSCFASRQPTVFSLRLSQFCTIQIQYSLFSSFSTADISYFLSSIALDRTAFRRGLAVFHSRLFSYFLSSIALDRTAFRSVQIDQSVVPSVQLSLDQRPSSPTYSSSSSLLHFDQTDIDAISSSRPTISPDLSAALADFQAALSEQMFAFQSEISSRMHKIEQSVCVSLRDQADIFRNLSQGARQEVRTMMGSADKKGESGSRGLQKPANTQKEGSAVTPSFEQRVQMAQRRIVQTVLDADANRESQVASERDRERRRKEAKSLKRRRRD